MRASDQVFVDTGAWIALALTRDPLHDRARPTWEELVSTGARLSTSTAIILETFTFLDRNANRQVALTWKDSLRRVKHLKILPVTAREVERSWAYFERSDLHKLSAVDAVSFVLMSDRKIRKAFAFDVHFATVGFRLVG